MNDTAKMLKDAAALLTTVARVRADEARDARKFDAYIGALNDVDSCGKRAWARALAAEKLALAAHDAWMDAVSAA